MSCIAHVQHVYRQKFHYSLLFLYKSSADQQQDKSFPQMLHIVVAVDYLNSWPWILYGRSAATRVPTEVSTKPKAIKLWAQ